MIRKFSITSPLVLACLSAVCAASLYAETPLLVENGEARASIVIAEEPPRTVLLAAEELQEYVKKLSGAELPIGNKPDDAYPLTIFIGKSSFTDELGITDEGLDHGAFQIVSTDDALILIGGDSDFTPTEPWHRRAPPEPEQQQAWEEITGRDWMNPMIRLFRSQNRETGLWLQDEGGSLNAVHEFLRSLGVRWYMPGDIGEVVPPMPSIPLEPVDTTVHPEFKARVLAWPGASYLVADRDGVMWYRRLGLNDGHTILGVSPTRSHGMRLILGHPEQQEKNPEFYAVYGGERETSKGGTGTPSLHSEALIQETIDFARAVFDHYDEAMVDIWPTDGFLRCETSPKDLSDSDYVWTFVDRVAREVYKTHPDRWISSGAYSIYSSPPESIEVLSPNVVVHVGSVAGAEAWKDRVAPGNLFKNTNNLRSLWYFNERMPFPILFPRQIAQDMQVFRGHTLGERSEVARRGEISWHKPGVNHLNHYVLSRYHWNSDENIDALLEEYYEKFYGPAGSFVQEAFELAEEHIPLRVAGLRTLQPIDPNVKIRFHELLQEARETAGESVYRDRIDLLLSEIEPIEVAWQELRDLEDGVDPRADAPLVVARDKAASESLTTYELVDLVTGEEASVATTFEVGWDDGALVFDIHCHEPDMENLYITENVWGGDSVAVLLETSVGTYYQLEINPDGDIFDAVRDTRVDSGWSSLADVKIVHGEDHWRAIVRIPVLSEEEGAGDPRHFVVGERASEENPWFVNVGRRRVRDGTKEAYGFSPTGGSYHIQDKFGRLLVQ